MDWEQRLQQLLERLGARSNAPRVWFPEWFWQRLRRATPAERIKLLRQQGIIIP